MFQEYFALAYFSTDLKKMTRILYSFLAHVFLLFFQMDSCRRAQRKGMLEVQLNHINIKSFKENSFPCILCTIQLDKTKNEYIFFFSILFDAQKQGHCETQDIQSNK